MRPLMAEPLPGGKGRVATQLPAWGFEGRVGTAQGQHQAPNSLIETVTRAGQSPAEQRYPLSGVQTPISSWERLHAMMTRTAPVVPLSPRRIAQIAAAAFAVTSAMLAVPSFSDEQRPISDFLHRAQAKADTHSFEQLMIVLGKNRGPLQSPQIHKAPLAKAPTPVALPRTQPLAQKIAQLPEVTIIERAVARQAPASEIKSGTRRRRTVNAVRQPAGAWAHRVSGILRQAGVRF